MQRETFPEAFKTLQNHADFDAPRALLQDNDLRHNKELRELQTLNLYIVDGVLRIGGCLKNTVFSDNQRHPILLPNNHPVTDLIVMKHYEEEGHIAISHVLTVLNKDYWIIHGRSAVNRIPKSCLNCRFWKAKPMAQQMGDLPPDRINKCSTFKVIGIDLMGPLTIRHGRNSLKRYVCIFNCLASRAVHFEVVQSLETSAFIQAFRRFCNRRNVQLSDVYSDNAGNFVAADKELEKGVENWQSKLVSDTLLQHGATWHFNPPRCSHQGEFYEIVFRLVRKLMRSIVGEATLDEFDLLTLIIEMERILNNRPITSLPSAPHDLSAITPSMIKTGSVADSLPPDEFVKADAYKKSWRKTQYSADLFWEKWTCEYLPLLQTRKKWLCTSRNLKPEDLVLVIDEQTKRGHWPKAIVQEVMPDSNGLVRRVHVRTAESRNLIRDIRKIFLLEGSMEDGEH